MTTAVYVRWRHLAADTKSCGGHTWINNDVKKIFEVSKDGITYYLVFAGIRMLPWLVQDLVTRYFITDNGKSFEKNLYEFKDEIKVHAWDRFEGIIVKIIKHTLSKYSAFDADLDKEFAYKINETSVEEILTSCTIGSGGDIAMGILLRDPEIPLEELYRLVSSKDTYTGEKFISIDLTK